MTEYGSSEQRPARPVWPAMLHGALLCCPQCGARSLFTRYLKVAEACEACGEELHHHRADDAPPYFTIFIVGHVLIPLVLVVERMWAPALSLQIPIWVALALVLTLVLLPPVKGAIVGLQWALYMHGFEYAARTRGEPVSVPPDSVAEQHPRP